MSVASMALKNLSRQKRRSVLLGGAIAFGLLVITVVNGLSASLITSLEANISNLIPGHIILRGAEKTSTGRVILTLKDADVFQAAVDKLQIPYSYVSKTTAVQSVALVSDFSTNYQSLSGVNLGPGSYLHDKLTIVEGQLDDFDSADNIVISESVAKKLNVQLGDRISVQGETVTGQQNVVDFYLRAIYKDPGVAASLAGAYAPLDRVNALRDMKPGEFTTFGIYLKDVSTADALGSALFDELKAKGLAFFARGGLQDTQKQYRDETWEGVKYSLYTLNDILAFIKGIFQTLNLIAFLILLVLFVVIMVGITNTYRMVVYERTREIGTLRALGMQRPDVRNLFLYEAIFLGLAGILVGFLVGVAILVGLSWVDLSAWKDFNILLKDNHLQLQVNLGSFALNLLVIVGLTGVAAFFPARRAGNLTPAEALRTTN
ncbi:MAG: FtsX-like permease family protein [Spirochaetales bacterium]